jgi:hypothetical protein
MVRQRPQLPRPEPARGVGGLLVVAAAILVVVPTGFVLGVAAVLLVWAVAR